jgi:GT2 family glycosyltransferase
MPLTSIVILTRNGLDMTRRCVESIGRHTSRSYELIGVDNGSTDGTVEYWESLPNIKLIRNKDNIGFAAGNNQGMTVAAGDTIVMLNNDTVVTPGWLDYMLERLELDPTIGIIGPVSNNVAPIQRVAEVGYHTLSELDTFALQHHAKNRGAGFYAHRLIGFCMLFRQSLLDRIGGLDERFYPGNYEDDDFSIRTRISGKRLWVAADVFIHHEGQGTYRANKENYYMHSIFNAEQFRKKWSVGLSAFEIDRIGYNPSDIVYRESTFLPELHYVPFSRRRNTEWTAGGNP